MLATVYGDVHDIGKSLVNTILSNNGYTVYDLGKQVPVNTIIEKALEVNADAIGLSALLVSTSKQMPLCVQELDRRGLKIPVLIGGAAINRRFGRRALFVEGERAYELGRLLLQGRVRGPGDDGPSAGRRHVARAFVAQLLDDARNDKFLTTNVGKDTRPGMAGGTRSDVIGDNPVPTAPFFGTRTLDGHSARRSLLAARPRRALSAAVGRARLGPEFEETVPHREFEPTLARLKESAKCDGWLRPRAVYGLFPVQSSGNDLVVYDPDAYSADGTTREIARFHFPRQEGRERLCIADYFRSVGVGRCRRRRLPDRDGRRRGDASASRRCRTPANTPKRSTCTDSPSKPRKPSPSGCIGRCGTSLGCPRGQGKRYSWGYGACPDLEDHAQLFKILPAERELGMQLTSAFQLIPEQSTAAIIVHHPQAKYYAVRGEGAGDATAA